MGRPSKPVAVLESEKKSHRTKAELDARRKAEAAVLSGKPLYERAEVKSNPVAHAEFSRIRKIMKNIQKDDALYSSGINTYCQLYAEIVELERDAERNKQLCADLQKKFDEMDNVDFEDICKFTDKITKLESVRLSIAAQIDNKRRIMLQIDKENLMTLAAALRSIPKNPEKQENVLLKILQE